MSGLLLLLLIPSAVSAASARIEGSVTDPGGHRLPGVRVVLVSVETGAEAAKTTDARGEFSFAGVSSGRYQVSVALEGYLPRTSTVRVDDAGLVRVPLSLELAPFAETVFITEEAVGEEPEEPVSLQEIPSGLLGVLPLPSDRFVEALPLLPGVVRGPEGKLNFNGARASQSTLLVNGSNVTDPLTGEFAIELPLKAVDTVEVFSIPYSAEFGSVTAAVTNVVTRAGDDHWDVDFDNLMPTPRFRNGTIMGISSATPRVQVSGPLRKGKAWFSQGASYRFVRSRVEGMLAGEDEEVLESFDSFTQLDFRLGEGHSLTTTFSYFPVETENLGLDTLHPSAASPEFESRGWNFAVADRFSTGSKTLWEATFAVKTFGVSVEPSGEGATRLTPDGLRDNYFNRLHRESTRWDLNVSFTHSIEDLRGPHVLKVGAQLYHTDFEGTDRSSRIELRGADGRLLETIDFLGEGDIGGNDQQIALYVQDRWRPTPKLGLDLGLRYDYEDIAASHRIAPRIAFAYSPRESGRTIVKGGWGLFYDQVFVHAASFESFQQRVETRYGPTGRPAGPPVLFRNRIDPEGLAVPRSTTWHLELNQAVGPYWMLRLSYRERRGRREMVVDRLADHPEGPTLLLSSRGRSMTRELDVTARRELPRDGEIFLSYVKSRTAGHLNNFGEIYDNLREPYLLASEYALQPFDVPHRLLLWGVVSLPKGIVLTPGIEWRSGFPYTVFEEDYTVYGGRNEGGRFPSLLAVDLRVTKALRLFGRHVRVGAQTFNVTGHFNPRDVIANRASPHFGELTNSIDFKIGARFEFSF